VNHSFGNMKADQALYAFYYTSERNSKNWQEKEI